MSTLGGLFTLIGQMGHSSGDYWCNMQIYCFRLQDINIHPCSVRPAQSSEPELSCSRVLKVDTRSRRRECSTWFVIQIRYFKLNIGAELIQLKIPCLVLFLQPIRSLYQENWTLNSYIHYGIAVQGQLYNSVEPNIMWMKQLSKGSYLLQEEPILQSHAPRADINRNYISSFWFGEAEHMILLLISYPL